MAVLPPAITRAEVIRRVEDALEPQKGSAGASRSGITRGSRGVHSCRSSISPALAGENVGEKLEDEVVDRELVLNEVRVALADCSDRGLVDRVVQAVVGLPGDASLAAVVDTIQRVFREATAAVAAEKAAADARTARAERAIAELRLLGKLDDDATRH